MNFVFGGKERTNSLVKLNLTNASKDWKKLKKTNGHQKDFTNKCPKSRIVGLKLYEIENHFDIPVLCKFFQSKIMCSPEGRMSTDN